MKKFQGLNYTLANEDTALELAVMPKGAQHILAVGGSGSRVIPLLANGPKEVTIVDLSRQQLLLVKLRLAALQEFTHSEYLAFFGLYPSENHDTRKALFGRLSLDQDAEEYFQGLFRKLNWNSLLYAGSWEKRHARLSKLVSLVMGESVRRLFAFETDEQYQRYLRNNFPGRRLNALLRGLGALLDLFGRMCPNSMPNSNVTESFAEEHLRIVNTLLARGDVRNNFFLQMMLLGRVEFEEGLPLEFDERVFARAKSKVTETTFHFVRGDVESCIRNSKRPLDFLSLSNVASYFSVEKERHFLQTIRPYLRAGAGIVSRQYRRNPDANEDRSGYALVNESYKVAIESEKTQIYNTYIYQKL